MNKKSIFHNPILPYLLIFPQIFIVTVFFFWPAGEALIQAFLMSDPFGKKSSFVWFENFQMLSEQSEYLQVFYQTIFFSSFVTILSLTAGLFLAVLANRVQKFQFLFRSLLIWPYAIAPAMAGILWLFILHPSYGLLGNFLETTLHIHWNPVNNGNHAMALVILAAAWKQISYNFVFFLSGLQSVPKSLLEAASIDGASIYRRFFQIVLPMISPTCFFLIVMNFIYAFFDSFGIIHTTTQGGPGGATNILVYKVYKDGFVGLDLGGSAAQSVILMIITLLLTYLQFRFVEKKVHYSG